MARNNLNLTGPGLVCLVRTIRLYCSVDEQLEIHGFESMNKDRVFAQIQSVDVYINDNVQLE